MGSPMSDAPAEPDEKTAIAARTALEHGEIEAALNSARSALSENASSREGLLVFAELALRAKNIGLTQKLLADVARKNPADVRAKTLAKRVAVLSGKAAAAKHVLLYTDDPGLGGVAQYNHALLPALVKNDFLATCVQTES